jgi:hypothetical protein
MVLKRSFLGLVGLVMVFPAFAEDWVARQGADAVVVHEKQPCPKAIRDLADQQGAPKDSLWLAATATVGGEKYKACWNRQGNAVFLVYEDGDIGVIPHDYFTPLKEI